MSATYAELESHVLDLLGHDVMSEQDFGDCALAIYRFQRENNRPYDNYCRHIGSATDLEHWKEIPAVPQTAFKQSALRTFPENETAATFRTSGTTGEGFGSHHFRSLRLYEEAIVRGWDFFRLPVMTQLILTPSPGQAPHSSLSHMMGTLKQRAADAGQYFCVGDSGELQIEQIHALIRDTNTPLLMMGTALAFLHLFEKGRTPALPEGSFALETGGYKGNGREMDKPTLYSLFTHHLGLAPDRVINEYGMTELSSQFYTRGIGNPHHGPPWLRALVINPETGAEAATGETGVLRIFDLANVGSVMAIQTHDLAVRLDRGFELIGRDPAALPRGCSRAADEMLTRTTTPQ